MKDIEEPQSSSEEPLPAGSQRHAVWASSSELMLLEFDKRLNALVELWDLDRNGFIDKEEFKQMALDSLRYELDLKEGQKLSKDDFISCQERAHKDFQTFDKNKNGLLEPKEMRAYFKDHVQLQQADEQVDLLM